MTAFSTLESRERFEAIRDALGKAPDKILYEDDWSRIVAWGQHAWLFYDHSAWAGALGSAQGESLEAALASILEVRRLSVVMDSAGAHLEEPMASLAAIDRLLESFWALRRCGIEINVLVPRYAFGGAAFILGVAAHRIILGPQASLALLGNRVTGSPGNIPHQEIALPPGFKPIRCRRDDVQAYLDLI